MPCTSSYSGAKRLAQGVMSKAKYTRRKASCISRSDIIIVDCVRKCCRLRVDVNCFTTFFVCSRLDVCCFMTSDHLLQLFTISWQHGFILQPSDCFALQKICNQTHVAGTNFFFFQKKFIFCISMTSCLRSSTRSVTWIKAT